MRHYTRAGTDAEVANASGGFGIRADFNPSAPVGDPATFASDTSAAYVEDLDGDLQRVIRQWRSHLHRCRLGKPRRFAPWLVAEHRCHPAAEPRARTPTHRWPTAFPVPAS